MSNLNAVYAAIDAYQFNRAIKLASALPDTNVLGKALLAHSYTKSGQKHQAVITLHKILIGGDGGALSTIFFELQSTLDQQNAIVATSASGSSAQTSKPEPASSAKKGKKGKKKPAPKQQQQTGGEDSQQPQFDLIDRLDVPPSVPEEIDVLPEKDASTSSIITDETTLATLAVSLKNLNLPLTAYQMYARAASTCPTEVLLTKTFAFGLSALAAPYSWDEETKARVEIQVLSHMQTVSLQLARVAVSSNDNSALMLATSWACQSAIWQLEWLPEDDKRSMILSRLAESMAKKLLQQETDKNQRSKEIFLLCLRILKRQSKWDEILELLEEMPDENNGLSTNASDSTNTSVPVSEFGVTMTYHQVKLESANALKKLDRYDDARLVYEDLLERSPDDWLCWKAHLQCSTLGKDSDDFGSTLALAQKAIQDREGSPFHLRGPHLMLVEIATEVFRRDSKDENIVALGSAIQTYAETFAHRANCTITDLDHYLKIILKQGTESGKGVVVSLLDFAESLRKGNSSIDFVGSDGYCQKDHFSKLRAYLFALKLSHRLLSANKKLAKKYLPDWIEIVKEWQTTFSLSQRSPGEEKQILKELEPGDDLVLLATQQLIFLADSQVDGSNDTMFIAAVLLESAIENSPGNAYLKFAAMEVFYRLDATTRSWDFFTRVGLKHIQLDSCSYVVFPYLFEGALYNEAITVSKALLRFHGGAVRDCGDFSGKAMNAGTLTKADEFMVFQREKMTQSLTFLYSKGLILDAAPLLATEVPRMKHDEDPILKGGIGITQGIVGGTEDMERTTQMVVESHNQYAALSVVARLDRGTTNVDGDNLCDNRDFSILEQVGRLWKPRTESKQSMVLQTLRRGHIHGLLIRASLCVDAMKGPKKGKVVKPSALLEKRTQSLLDSVLSATEFFDSELDGCKDHFAKGCHSLLHMILSLCRFLSIVNAGMPKGCSGDDSMDQREQHSVEMIQNHALKQLKEARSKILPITSPKTVGAILPSYILPVFALVKMCSTVLTAYGWGKRKSTKKVSVAMSEFCKEFQELLEDNLKPCLGALPSTEMETSTDFSLTEEAIAVLDADTVTATKTLLNQARYRTRMRLQPILEEMIDFLDEFDVSNNE